MKSLLWLGALLVAGCSWTSDGGVTERRESEREGTTQSAEGSWKGEPISVINTHGSVQVVGVPGKTSLSMRARFVAGANSAADAEAAFADVERSMKIEKRDGVWVVECDEASERHGSAVPSSTGCTSAVVEVPAGASEAAIDLSVYAPFGGVHAAGLVVSRLSMRGPFGLVAAVSLAKGAKVDMTGADLVSGFCSTILSVPAEQSIDQAQLSVANPDVKMAHAPDDPAWAPGVEIRNMKGFSGVIEPRSKAFQGAIGKSGEGAASVVLHASIGKATVGAVAVPAYDPFNQCKNLEPVKIEAGF